MPTEMRTCFRTFAERNAILLGKLAAFLGALGFVLAWASTGPLHLSEMRQIFASTATTIVSVLMVFLLQNTQARDSIAIPLQRNELLRPPPKYPGKW